MSGGSGWTSVSRPGRLTPAWIHLDNRGKEREVTVHLQWAGSGMQQEVVGLTPDGLRDRAGPPTIFRWSLPAKTQHRISVVTRAPTSDRYRLWAFVLDGRKTIASSELFGASGDDRAWYVGVVGRDLLPGLVPSEDVAVVRIDADDLPESWAAYTSLDALVWLDGDPAEARSPAQQEALRQWVLAGGLLVVARGTPVGLKGSFLEDLLPAEPAGSRTVDTFRALSRFGAAPKGETLLLECRAKPRFCRLMEGNLPLLVERPRGAGRVGLLAFDPARAPFDRWEHNRQMWWWIFGLPAGEIPADRRYGEDPDPLATQLRFAASNFEGVRPPSLGWLFALLFLYAVVVGPLDYFVLRSLKKFELTWITFPVYVIGFAVVVLVLGGAFVLDPIRGREVIVRDYYAEEETSRTWTVASVLPSLDRTFSVSGPPNAAHLEMLGMAENPRFGMGGANPDSGVVIAGPSPEIREMRLQRSVYGTCRAEWLREEEAPLEIEESSAGIRVANRGPLALEDVVVLMPEMVLKIGTLAAGSEFAGLRGSARYGWQDLAGEWQELNTRNPYEYDHYGYDQSFDRDRLKNLTRQALVLLSLPLKDDAPRLRPRPEMTRALDVRRWLEAGGRVVIGWGECPPLLRFAPAPAKHSVDCMIRVFLPPEKTP